MMRNDKYILVLFLAGIGMIHSTSIRADESLPQSAHKLKLAIEDLIETHGSAYPEGRGYLRQLDVLLPKLNANRRQAREVSPH